MNGLTYLAYFTLETAMKAVEFSSQAAISMLINLRDDNHLKMQRTPR